MGKYAEIVEKLEKMQAPNFKIDCEIWKALEESRGFACPHYSASLDAAMLLVSRHLPGEWIDIGGMTDSSEWECNIHTDYVEVMEHGPTAAIAVLKALFQTLKIRDRMR